MAENSAPENLNGELQTLADKVWNCVRVIKGSTHMPRSPELTSDLAQSINDLMAGLQDLRSLLSDSAPTVVPSPHSISLDDENASNRPHEIEPSRPEKKSGRRRPSFAFDYLLLEALNQRSAYGHRIGQESLFRLASALDENSKKPSLVAKLNRWKNDKKWVSWVSAEDISILGAGNERRAELLDLVNRDKRMEEIRTAFKSAWSLDLGPQ